MRLAIGAALLLVSLPAGAEDAGDRGYEDDGATAVLAQDAAESVEAATIACDGALCETQTGTTCDLLGVSPGRFSPSCADRFGILGALLLAAIRRRSVRRPTPVVRLGRRAHPAEA